MCVVIVLLIINVPNINDEQAVRCSQERMLQSTRLHGKPVCVYIAFGIVLHSDELFSCYRERSCIFHVCMDIPLIKNSLRCN